MLLKIDLKTGHKHEDKLVNYNINDTAYTYVDIN